MSKSSKPRKKHYRQRYTSAVSPVTNRPLTSAEIERMHDQVNEVRLKLHLGSSDRDAADLVAAYLGYGYIIAENFEQGDELKARFKHGFQALNRCAFAAQHGLQSVPEDLAVIDEALDYAVEEISTLDVMTVSRLEKYFIEHSEKLFDLALREDSH